MNMQRTPRSAANADALGELINQIERDAKADVIECAVSYVNDELPAGDTPSEQAIKDALDMAREWCIGEALGDLTDGASGRFSANRIVDSIRARKFADIARDLGRGDLSRKSWVRDIEREFAK